MFLTILTATYNRKNDIYELYNSLSAQSVGGFEWLVVDDGSCDGTKELVQSLEEASSFPIRYIYKENGGKHTALNVGIGHIDNPLTFIVDSDDKLTIDAVEQIKIIYEKYKKDQSLCGYTFLRAFSDGKINGKLFRNNEMIASYIDARINNNDTNSDKAEVFITKCLKEFPFPEYPGEKFLGEDIVWIRMARKYKMVHINKAIYIGNYLTGGLTKNRRVHNIKSPVGCFNRAREFMCPDIKFKYRVKGTLQYIVYGRFAGYKVTYMFENAPKKLLFINLYFIGNFIHWKWNKEK